MSNGKGIALNWIGDKLVFPVVGIFENEQFWKRGRLVYNGDLRIGDGGFCPGGIKVSDATGEANRLGVGLIIYKRIDNNFG